LPEAMRNAVADGLARCSVRRAGHCAAYCAARCVFRDGAPALSLALPLGVALAAPGLPAQGGGGSPAVLFSAVRPVSGLRFF